MNYINNSLKQIVVFMNPKLETLQKLVKSFTVLDPVETVDTVHDPLDGEGLSESMVITGEGGMLETLKDKIQDKFTFF